MNYSAWDAPAVEQLKALWSEGLSCSQIARALGGGLTRCAVIGKASRLGLSGRAVPSRKPKVSYVRPVKPPSFPPVPQEQPSPIGEIKEFVKNGQCKYIHGEVSSHSDWRMCGHATGSILEPFCPFHHSICYSIKHPATRAVEGESA